jgi:bacterioferritin
MKGKGKVIEKLNALLSDELAAANQYILHSEMCENWRYGRLHAALRKRAVDEMKHAERLIARILFLEGRPIVDMLGMLKIGADVADIHDKDWAAESKAISDYNAGVKAAQEAEDGGTRDLLESILVEEEAHIDWIEAQRGQIDQMGLENYLGRQTDGE